MSTAGKHYHHGSLKEAVVEAGLTMLEEGESESISIREIARRTGVSSAAVFRHYSNREAVLAALAARGFADLAAYLREAQRSDDDPIKKMGVAYVDFAVRHPGLFRLMFGAGLLNGGRHPDLQSNSAAAFSLLDATAGAVAGNTRDDAISRWARVHGLAHLALDGLLEDVSPKRIRALLSRS